MCVCVYTCMYATYVWVPVVSKTGSSDSLGLELQVVNHTTSVMGTKLMASGRAASLLTSEPSLQLHTKV